MKAKRNQTYKQAQEWRAKRREQRKQEMSHQEQTLTPVEEQALKSLRYHQEEYRQDEIQKYAGKWASVYLDNAIPFGWTLTTWRSVLASLTKKDLYRPDDGSTFGLVKL